MEGRAARGVQAEPGRTRAPCSQGRGKGGGAGAAGAAAAEVGGEWEELGGRQSGKEGS